MRFLIREHKSVCQISAKIWLFLKLQEKQHLLYSSHTKVVRNKHDHLRRQILSQSAFRQCNKLTCIQIDSNQLLSTGFFSLAFCRPLNARGTPDHGKETQNKVVWSCFQFIRYGQNHLARHSERGKKTRQTEEEVGG